MNPFVISEKIIPEYFCDRKEESKLLLDLLTNGNNIVLISHRRIGKTALIQYCFENKRIKKEFITIYVDILSTNNLREFIFLLGKSIISKIMPLGKRMLNNFIQTVRSLSGKLGYDPMTGSPTINFQLGDVNQPEFTLKEIFQYLDKAGKPCIVAIDEFQQVAKYPEVGVEALIRSHLHQINNCRFIFSGSERHLLEQMFTSPARPFFNSCTFIELKVIPRDIYVAFIKEQFQKENKEISEELAIRIYDKFDGYTFYVQRVCNGIFSMTSEGEEASEKMMEETVANLLFSYDTIYRERLHRLSTRQKELLFAVAKEGKVERINSVEFIQRNALASASAVQTAEKTLLKSDILGKEFGIVFISDKFFALWLRKNYC